MKLFVILFLLFPLAILADYVPEQENRSGLTIGFGTTTNSLVGKFVGVSATGAGMSLSYMISDSFIFGIGYEGMLNKDITADIPVGELNESAVLNSNVYYATAMYKYNFDLRWGLALGLQAGLNSLWYETNYKDSNGNPINLDLGKEKVVVLFPQINLYYRVRDWLDASFLIGYKIYSNFEYKYEESFLITQDDSSSPLFGIGLHFGFY
jgi:hypothetical protein